MKGIVFTEFITMVESKFGDEMADIIIMDSNLPSKGVYTSVGTYDHQELFSLVSSLSKHSNIGVPELVKAYGMYVFKVFSHDYKYMFEGVHDAFSFLENIETGIHVDVLKLYPEAELPQIMVTRPDKNSLILTYSSVRKLADFAEGLIIGCLNYFEEKATIERVNINADNSKVRFTLSKVI